MWAAQNGLDKIVGLLIKAGADVNQRDEIVWTALLYAADHGKCKCMELLIKAGADVNIQKITGRTALICRIVKHHYK